MTLPQSLSRAALRDFRAWSALRHRNYRLFFVGQLISLVGTWMQTVAQAWLVLALTGSPFVLGLVAAAQFTPVLVFGLFGGLIADHLPKRRTLIATQASAMTLAFVLALLTATNTVQVWHIFVLALLLGFTNAIDMPTRQAFSVEMVGRSDVTNAVALNSAIFNAARVIGPAVAGLSIAAFGTSVAFFLNGASFLAVIAGLALMRDAELTNPPAIPRPTTVAAVFQNLAEGLRYVRETPIVLLAVAVVALVATFGMNFNVLVPAMSKDVLGAGADGYGFLMAASGVGSLIAAISLALLGRPRPGIIVGGGLLLGILEVAFAVSRSFPLSLLCMFGIGVGGIAMAATANTTIQLNVPDHLRGRVLSVYTTLFAGSTPIGGIAMGAIAASAGTPTALIIGGVISTAVCATAWLWLRRRSARAPSTGARAASGQGPRLRDQVAGSPSVGQVRTAK
jgi:MFS family permease